jgi:hypothetical protein
MSLEIAIKHRSELIVAGFKVFGDSMNGNVGIIISTKKKKPKDKNRIKIKARKNPEKNKEYEILYVCKSCGEEECIPEGVFEYFDTMDDGDISVPPTFSYENCEGIMYPQKYEGVHGISYTFD